MAHLDHLADAPLPAGDPLRAYFAARRARTYRLADFAGSGRHEPLARNVIIDILTEHEVETGIAPDGSVRAWEEATITINGVTTDASEWVPAPTTYGALVEWLGY